MPMNLNALRELTGISSRPLPDPERAEPTIGPDHAIQSGLERAAAIVNAVKDPLIDFMQNNYTGRIATAATSVAAPAIRFTVITGAADAASQYVQFATYRYLNAQSEDDKQRWFLGLGAAGVGLMVLSMVAQRIPGLTRQQANKVKDASRLMSATLVSVLLFAAKAQGVPQDQAGAGLAGSITYPLVRDESEALFPLLSGRDGRNLDRWQASASGIVTFMAAQFGTAELRDLWGATGGLQMAIDGKTWGETVVPTLKHAIIHPLGEFAPFIAGTLAQAYYDKLGRNIPGLGIPRTFDARNPREDRALDELQPIRGVAGMLNIDIGVTTSNELSDLLDAFLNPATMRINFIHALVLSNLIKQTAGGLPIADENLRDHIDNLIGAAILGLLAVMFEGGIHHEPVREDLRYDSKLLRGQDDRPPPPDGPAFNAP